MNLALWIAAALLAAAFLLAGGTKLLMSRARIAASPGGGWAMDFPSPFVKILGVLEVLGAVGLIAPAVTGVASILVPVAASAIGVLMMAAGVVVLRRHESPHALVNLGYLLIALFVAIGRFGPCAF